MIRESGPCRRVRIEHGNWEHRGKPSYGKCRAVCTTCWWHGPWVSFASTAERHRGNHLYRGRHRV